MESDDEMDMTDLLARKPTADTTTTNDHHQRDRELARGAHTDTGQSGAVADAVDVEWCADDSRWSRVATDTHAAFDVVQQVDDAGVPVLVNVIHGTGRSLTVGVGRIDSVLCFQTSVDGPNYWSVGDDDSNGVTHFWCGEQSEFSNRQVIPKAQANAALREFLRTGERPTTIAWQEV